MKTELKGGAVLYVRVSTDEQAAGPLNLQNQENNCRRYCEQNQMMVVEVFTDPGASARSADRPQFQRMLAFCRANKGKVHFVVVQDLSRLARNNEDQAQTIRELRRINVSVRSTCEASIGETAGGKLAANIFGTFNQYHSDALSEKMQDRTRQAVLAGRFPWKAPIGYRNIGGKTGPNIVPDDGRAPLIRKAFELMATGQYKKAEVLRIITKDGLRTISGKHLTKQTFQALLRNPLYSGWVALASDKTFAPVLGLHEPIISVEIFNRVTAILNGRTPAAVTKQKVNPIFPLKHFVRCDACGTPLTA